MPTAFVCAASPSGMDTAPLVVLVRLSVGSAFQQTVRSPPKPVKPQLAHLLSWNMRGVEEPSSIGLKSRLRPIVLCQAESLGT